VGECFCWYQPTRVDPDKGQRNSCVCETERWTDTREMHNTDCQTRPVRHCRTTCPASEVTPSRRRDRETFDVTEPTELSDSWLPLRSRLDIRVVLTGIRLTEPGPPRRDDATRDTLDTGANRPKVGTHWKYLPTTRSRCVVIVSMQ